ncbi:hypothetical protein [Bradyrhizobium sp. CW1]|uniref:hypothetical protein n=1 Tax=Bradyrhizobium sp. CW1 TaxID=2782686 RepID=UPI001FFFE9B6|nr:hypothetical protein [Bradyrhizobium sp. CW1]UPJ28885.1 transposase [Bradyrhizobium sp. CW1]
MLWGGDEDIASIVADEPMERPMQKLNDLSRSSSPLDPNGTLIAVIELSLLSWLVAGIVPGVERQPLKKLAVDESALLKLLHRWREEATKAGHRIKRIAVVFEAGRDGFWLARWLRARDIEAHVIHASSVAVSREHRRAKTDRLDTELLKRSFLGWLRGERDHCKMVAIPTIQDEDAKRPNREHESLVGEQSRIVNRMKAALIRLGIRGFNPKLKKAAERVQPLAQFARRRLGVAGTHLAGVEQLAVLASADVERGDLARARPKLQARQEPPRSARPWREETQLVREEGAASHLGPRRCADRN